MQVAALQPSRTSGPGPSAWAGAPGDLPARLDRAYARAQADDLAAQRAAARDGTVLHADFHRVTWAELAQGLHAETGAVLTTDLAALADMAGRDVAARLGDIGLTGGAVLSVAGDARAPRITGADPGFAARLSADAVLRADLADAFALRESAEIQRVASAYAAAHAAAYAGQGSTAAAQVTRDYGDRLAVRLTLSFLPDGQVTHHADQRA